MSTDISAEQSIRIEAVAQANRRLGQSGLIAAHAVTILLEEARRIERYIADGELPEGARS